MSTPKPGQIRCPTCHESTPPGAFCTRCGQPIPASARARPRGLDRQELEDRLRGRRPGDSPYRRGGLVGEPPAGGGFDRFEPEPEDALAVRHRAEAASSQPRPDNLAPPADPETQAQPAEVVPERPAVDASADEPVAPRWPREAPHRAAPTMEPAQDQEPPYEAETRYQPRAEAAVDRQTAAPRAYEPRREAERAYVPPPAAVAPPHDEGYYDYGTDYDYDNAPYYQEERRGGGPWLILGIIGLGLVALLGGVLLSGVFDGGPGVARETSTPTLAANATATPTPGGGESGTPAPSTQATPGAPGTFPDGFTAKVEPCATTTMNPDGCAEDGTTLTGDTVWVWAGFTKGTGSDVVGVTLVDSATDEEIQDASLELSQVNCGEVCNGYLKFSFSGLSAGDYTLRVTRNGTFAAEAPFTVS